MSTYRINKDFLGKEDYQTLHASAKVLLMEIAILAPVNMATLSFIGGDRRTSIDNLLKAGFVVSEAGKLSLSESFAPSFSKVSNYKYVKASRAKAKGAEEPKEVKQRAPKAEVVRVLCDYDEIFKIYVKHLPTHPRPQFITDKLKRVIKQSWDFIASLIIKANPETYSKERVLEEFESIFHRVAMSDFLCGRNPEIPGSQYKPRKFELEWLMTLKNLQNIVAGKYDNRK